MRTASCQLQHSILFCKWYLTISETIYMHFRRFFHPESESVGRIIDLSRFKVISTWKCRKTEFFALLGDDILKSSCAGQIFQPDLDSAQKITWENILGNISMKNEIFVNFYSFLSVEKNDLMMVLFFGLIRIQRVKIHKNSRVSTPAQYTFFFVGLWNNPRSSKYYISIVGATLVS